MDYGSKNKQQDFGVLEFGNHVINSSVDFVSYFLLTSVRYISLINGINIYKIME